MKRFLKTLIISAFVITAVAGTSIAASASSFTTQANSLKEMGLFIGTEKGFELDRAPTRAEAAVMLVRLLGKEAEAKNGTYIHPFNDVPVWADKYVGFLYKNGLTKGTSYTTFSPQQNCDLQMYSTFLLRSLGYTEDNGSFTYAEAKTFAESLGLIDSSTSSSSTFLRDDVAGLSYSALFQKTNNSDKTLLQNLASQNAVASTTADKYNASYNLYKNYLTAIKNANSKSTEANSNSIVDMTVMNTTMRMTQDSVVKTVLSNNKITAQIDSTTSFMGSSYQSSQYFANGWLYTNSQGQKFKVPFALNNMMDLNSINSSQEPFYLINSITKSETSAGTVYTIDYVLDAANKLIGSSLSSAIDTASVNDVNILSLKISAVVGTDGQLKSQNISIYLIVKMVTEGQSYDMGMKMTSTVTIVNTGDSVKVTLPADLDSYEDLTAE